jgi:cysteinyl-tRNA synthetase
MKTEQEEVKHTPLPWKIGMATSGSTAIVADGHYDKGIIMVMAQWRKEYKFTAEFTLEACNNYYSLKSQLQQLQEEMKEDEHAMKILVAQVQQLQEEIERLKIALGKNVIRDFNELHGVDATKSDSEVKTLREALIYANEYLKKGGFGRVDCQKKVEAALQSKGESGLDTKE